MTQPATTSGRQGEAPGGARMVVAMGGVGLIAAVLLVVTFQATAPYIAQNRADFLERALAEVLPEATRRVAFTRTPDDRLVPVMAQDKEGFRLYAGYDELGALVGVAVEAQGQGFQDVLRILYGYAPDCQCVVGMKVLESKETPGLGDKIEHDAAFRANFEALDVRLVPDQARLLHPVESVKKGSKEQPWQVEAITGATISSKAIAAIIDQSAEAVVPLIHQNMSQLREER